MEVSVRLLLASEKGVSCLIKALSILILLSWTWSSPGHGQDIDQVWEDKVFDNPQLAEDQLEKRMKTLNPLQNAYEWLLAFRQRQDLAAFNFENLEYTPEVARDFAQALKIARASDQPWLALEIERLHLDASQTLYEDPNKQQELYQELLNRPETQLYPYVKGRIWESLGRFYDRIGKAPLAIHALNEALSSYAQNKMPTHYTLNASSSLGAIMVRGNEFQKGIELLEGLVQKCEDKRWRYFCAVLNYSAASVLLNEGSLASIQRAQPFWKEQRRLAKKLENQGLLADGAYLQLKYHMALDEFEEALHAGEEALQIYQKLAENDFVCFTHERLAHLWREHKNYDKAIYHAQQALVLLEAKDFQGTRKDIYHFLYEINKEYAHQALALSYLELFVKEDQRYDELKEKSSYSDAVAKFGLHVEEEKNKTLMDQLDKQKIMQMAMIVVLILLLVSLVLGYSYFHQFRRIKQLEFWERLAQQKEKSDQILALETELRLQLASSLAHQVNNPLNQVLISMRDGQEQGRKVTEDFWALLGENTTGDPERLAIEQHFRSYFAKLSQSFQGIQEGTERAMQAVAAVRLVSGVDGCALDHFPLQRLWQAIDERMNEFLSQADWGRVHMSLDLALQAVEIESNIPIMRNAFELMIRALLKECSGSIELRVQGCDRSCLTLEVQTMSSLAPAFLGALETSLTHVLTPAGWAPLFTLTDNSLHLSLNRLSPHLVAA